MSNDLPRSRRPEDRWFDDLLAEHKKEIADLQEDRDRWVREHAEVAKLLGYKRADSPDFGEVDLVDVRALLVSTLNPPPVERPTFEDALRDLINRYSIENASDTPDFILASHVCMTLAAFAETTRMREAWYGRGPKPSDPSPSTNPSEGPPR